MPIEAFNAYFAFVEYAYSDGQTFFIMHQLYAHTDSYPIGDGTRNDIQIMHSDLEPGSDNGFYFCVYYDHLKNKLYIYVYSKSNNALTPKVRGALERLYPSIEIGRSEQMEFVTLDFVRRYKMSSGLASMAVATVLLFGINPKDIQIKSSEDYNFLWRAHLHKMLNDGEITPFPSDSPDSINPPKVISVTDRAHHPIRSAGSRSKRPTPNQPNTRHQQQPQPQPQHQQNPQRHPRRDTGNRSPPPHNQPNPRHQQQPQHNSKQHNSKPNPQRRRTTSKPTNPPKNSDTNFWEGIKNFLRKFGCMS